MRRKTYASSAQSTRTSPERNEGEVAECGGRVNGNELAVFAAEGELPAGGASIVDNALGVYSPPLTRRSDLEEYLEWFRGQNIEKDEGLDGVRGLSIDSPPGSSIDSPMAGSFSLPYDIEDSSKDSPLDASGDLHVAWSLSSPPDWNVPMRSWKIPPHAVHYLSDDEDQLGPIPEEWNAEKYNVQEERDLQEAIMRSIDDRNMPGDVPDRASSCAVIVEVTEDTAKRNHDGKRKDISAGERSAGFAEYTRKMGKLERAGSSSKAGEPGRKKGAKKEEKAPKKAKNAPEKHYKIDLSSCGLT
ncbi:hypothetical protein B0H14DRAFT_2584580 [Mycena olivaceomarginata]|nr:hypothetical protein B0H14DRAFT_2584580 [Mycena olivaceomarginata]